MTEVTEGQHCLRPFHLAWRSDFGLSSMIEPDEMYTLAELYLTEGHLATKKIHKVLSF